MSSAHIFIRLARCYIVRAVRDELYARRLLDSYAGDATTDAPLERLELSRAVRRAHQQLEPQALDMADTLHFAVFGYLERPTTKVHDSASLHRGLDTGYGWPAVLMEASVTRLALELPAIADALSDRDQCSEVAELATFYQAAALAGQVMIVGEV